MQLKVIGTGSQGNAYLLENEEEALLIECGVNFKEIKKALKFNLKKLVGCIVTHEHGDHAKSIKEIVEAGITVYATKGTYNAKGIQNSWKSNAKAINQKDDFKIGNFKIKSFDVNHDAAEPVGFLINHPECGTTLFLTDTFYCGYTFRGLNNIIIEANYSEEIIDKKLIGDKKFLRDRVIQSHMSLETCVDFMKANDLSKVNNIVLIHLSDSNSDEKMFGEVIKSTFNKTTYVANNGLEIEFNKTPF